MIKVEKLIKRIDGHLILDQVNMHVPKGAVYGLVGPNGAGKSTLMRALVGTYRTDFGTILIDGRPIYENPAAKEDIAYIPDDIFYTVTDNIMSLAKFYSGMYKDFDWELFEKLFEYFPMITKKKLIRSYSKGMQRQAAFMLAVCTRPKVMILDEPLDGLDPLMRRQILSLIASEVANRQMSVLISSHNLRELEDICDHVGIMDRGKVVIERSLEQLQASVMKIQMAFKGEAPQFSKELEILHKSTTGRVVTLIIRGERENIEEKLKQMDPILLDIIPLSLEEIFIYEMGGAEDGTYKSKDIRFAWM